jgi:hypothetical protein
MFATLGRQYGLIAYSSIFDLIPDDKKYEVFARAYCMPDRGYVMPKIITKIAKLKPKELVESLKKITNNEGYITIYRGENARSTELKKALSWTLTRKQAVFFATTYTPLRIPENGCLYTANADINKVIAYITEGDEEEILIRYKDIDLIDIEEIKVNMEGSD